MADLIPDPPQDVCANCAAPLPSSFCAACGQKRVTERMRTRDILRDLWDKLIDVESGFLHTCWCALVRPHQVVIDWLSGKRRPYTPPARFLFVVLTVEFLIQGWLMRAVPVDAVTRDQLEKMYEVLSSVGLADADPQESMRRIQWLTMVLMLPCVAFGTWLLFRPWQRTYAEHLAGASYVYAGWALIATPIMIFETASGLRLGNGMYPILMALMPFWFTWAFTRSFPGGSRIDRIGRTIGAAAVALSVLCVPTCAGVTVYTVVQAVQGKVSGR